MGVSHFQQMEVARQSLGWKKAQARVLTAETRRVEIKRKIKGTPVRRHFVNWQFTYSFEVDGRTYTSHVVSLPTDTLLLEKAINQHPVGSTLEIRFDPKDPEVAVVFPGPSEGSEEILRLYTLTTAISAVLGLFCFVGSGMRKVAETEPKVAGASNASA